MCKAFKTIWVAIYEPKSIQDILMKWFVVHLLFISEHLLSVYQEMESEKQITTEKRIRILNVHVFIKQESVLKRDRNVVWSSGPGVGGWWRQEWRRLWWEWRNHTRLSQETLHPWPPEYLFPSRSMGKFIMLFLVDRRQKRLLMEINLYCCFVRWSQSHLAFRQSICGWSYH